MDEIDGLKEQLNDIKTELKKAEEKYNQFQDKLTYECSAFGWNVVSPLRKKMAGLQQEIEKLSKKEVGEDG